ncbi:uncharacterized protein LOC131860360 [Cryptomeria japonica]|uniref:uncharacterized protein LOC131860360 n=1 Tax=Cryptomeria japonica TaxID=3369 RepID=UPI0027DA1A88|nr:uncharacterized protein LOC131860360 [Cryptomeria japonica]
MRKATLPKLGYTWLKEKSLLKFQINETLMAIVIGLGMTGRKFYRDRKIEEEDLTSFFEKDKERSRVTKRDDGGYNRKDLMAPWADMVEFIMRYGVGLGHGGHGRRRGFEGLRAEVVARAPTDATMHTYNGGQCRPLCAHTVADEVLEQLLSELSNENVVKLVNMHINHMDMSLYLAFDYAEYDVYEIIQHHQEKFNHGIYQYTVKSFLWWLLNGLNYLHSNWIVHHDLKPSNILVMGDGDEHGVVKIIEFGLARIYQAPL